MFDVFWVLFGVVYLSGVFLASSIHCVCVCARSLAHLAYIGSGYPFVLWGSTIVVVS